MHRSLAKFLIMLFLCSLPTTSLFADELRVAVSSNFTGAIKQLAAQFEASSGQKVVLIFGSTGKHYAQIKHGAPFDLFFAADTRRPELLEQEGVAVPESRFTYAFGKLALWSPNPSLVDNEGAVLERSSFRFLALANPKLAPYGKAAQEVLEKRQLWKSLQPKIVRGENIGQTYQFVKSGNAELGLVALAQISADNAARGGSLWEIPDSLYTPIEQQAVALTDSRASREFLAYVKSPEGLAIIQSFGYGTP